MLSFTEYRKNKLQESINALDSNAAFNKEFEVLKLQLLEALEFPKVFSESLGDEVHDQIAEAVMTAVAQEDYYNCNVIVSHFVEEFRNELHNMFKEAGEAAATKRYTLDNLKAIFNKNLTKYFGDFKNRLVKVLQGDRQSAMAQVGSGFAPQGAGGMGGGFSNPVDNLMGGSPNPMGGVPSVPNGPANQTPQQPAPGTPQQPATPQGQGGQPVNGTKPRRGVWGWIKHLFNPQNWSRWWKGTKRLGKAWNMMGQDDHPLSKMIDKRYDKFQNESFFPLANFLEAAMNNQMDVVSKLIDNFTQVVLKYADAQIDRFAKLTGAPITPTASAPKNLKASGATTSPSGTNPTQPAIPTGTNAAPGATAPMDVKNEPGAPVDTSSTKTLSTGEPAYTMLGKSVLFQKGQRLRNNLLKDGITFSTLMNLPKTPAGRRALQAWAISTQMNPNRIPDSSVRTSQNWMPVVAHLKGALKHFGLLKPEGEGVVSAPADLADEPQGAAPETLQGGQTSPATSQAASEQPKGGADGLTTQERMYQVFNKIKQATGADDTAVEDAVKYAFDNLPDINNDSVDEIAARLIHGFKQQGSPAKEEPQGEKYPFDSTGDNPTDSIQQVLQDEPAQDFSKGYSSGGDENHEVLLDTKKDFVRELQRIYQSKWDDDFTMAAEDEFDGLANGDIGKAQQLLSALEDDKSRIKLWLSIKRKAEQSKQKAQNNDFMGRAQRTDSYDAVMDYLSNYRPRISRDNVEDILSRATIHEGCTNQEIVDFLMEQLEADGIQLIREA